METTSSFEIPTTAILSTEKCFIRPHHDSDAAAMAAAGNDPDISRYMRNTFPSPYTVDDANYFIKHIADKVPRFHFLICLLDGTLAGGIGLVPGIDTGSRTYEIGYWVGKDHWGKGVTTSAVKGFSRWAFSAFPDLLRIEAGVYEGNDASTKVLEKAGYKKEGVRRKAVFKHGQAWDVAMFGLLKEDLDAQA